METSLSRSSFIASSQSLKLTASSEYRQMTQHLESLQEQVDGLYKNLAALQRKIEPLRIPSVGPLDPQIAYATPSSTHVAPQPQHPPQFPGPATSPYGFDVANDGLPRLGMNGSNYQTESSDSTRDGPVPVSGPSNVNDTPQQTVNTAKDPILALSQDEVMRLCMFYDEVLAESSPMLDMEEIIKKAKTLFSFMDSLRKLSFLQTSMAHEDAFADDETLILKVILATATVIENVDPTEIGRSLFESVRRKNNLKDRLGCPASIKYIQLLCLMVCKASACRG